VGGLGIGLAEEVVELFELASLALPAHPDALLRVPAALAVEEEEAVRARGPVAGGGAVAAVEVADGLARGGERLVVARHVRLGRVAEVGEEGEAERRVRVRGGVDLELLDL